MLTFEQYSQMDFVVNIYEAEQTVFGEDICSPNTKQNESECNLWFIPFYVIDDDMFEVMSFQIAVSSFAKRLDQKQIVRSDPTNTSLRVIAVDRTVPFCSRWQDDSERNETETLRSGLRVEMEWLSMTRYFIDIII